MNLIIILAVLFGSLAIIVTLAEKYAKPPSEEQMQKYSKIMGVLMLMMVIGSVIRFMMDKG